MPGQWKLKRDLFADWPADADELPTAKVIELYENKFAGAKYSPEAWEEFRATQPEPDGDDVTHKYGLADTGAGKLVIPFVFVLEQFPNCWPGRQGQARGDCVSWGSRNATLLTLACDIVSGLPDEKTKFVEGIPEVPPEGIADGVLSTEAYYWWRGYNGDGWHCPSVAKVATTKSGAFLRKNYPDLGFDLTRYSGRNAGLYGSKSPGAEIQKVGGERLIHAATNADSFESRRDLLFNGYGLLDCGGEGYSDSRDDNGVSKRSGSWAHSMCEVGVDDRDQIKQLYGEPLVLILNSWARWNSGPRDIYQSAGLVPAAKKQKWVDLGIVNPNTGNITIPDGSFWCRWSQCKNREVIAYSGVAGWPAKSLPIDWQF
jgi:hypothetical protein